MTQVDFAIYAMGAIFAGPTADGTNGQVLVTNGSKQLSFATIVSDVSDLNSLTGSLSIAVGTSGTDVAVTASGSTVTVNIPDAGASARGVLTTGTQTIAGTKTLTGNTVLNPASGAPLTVQLASADKFYVDASGNTTVQNASLTVKTTTGNYGSGVYLTSNITGGKNYIFLSTGSSDPGGAGQFLVYDATTGVPRITATSTGVHRHYYDATNYLSTTITSGGNATLAPTGGQFAIQSVASHSSPIFVILEVSSTPANREQFAVDTAWIDSTDATRKARVTLNAYDTAIREFARGWGDGSKGRFAITTPASAPTDAHLAASQISFYLDESGHNLIVRVKYADGTTLKTATIALV